MIKKRGRPRNDPDAERKRTLGFYMADEMRDRLLAAAKKQGRTISDEIRCRLEASLVAWPELVVLTYYPQLEDKDAKKTPSDQ